MKAVSIQVSLNPELAEFVRTDSRSGAFDSASDYVRELIRRRREEQIAADVALLQSAIHDAPAGDPRSPALPHRLVLVRRKECSPGCSTPKIPVHVSPSESGCSVLLDYRDQQGQTHRLSLVLQGREDFLRVLGFHKQTA